MSLSSEKIKIVTADIYYYNSSLGREEVLKVSSFPFAGYLPLITSVYPFSSSVQSSGISTSWGGLIIANISGELDYIVCNTENTYVFNKRRVVLKVYTGTTLELETSGIILDVSADDVASLTLRYTDPMAELDQPLITINSNNTNPYVVNSLDRYKPYTLNQLYNDIRGVTTGIPNTNPRFSERENVLPFCMGDIFNYQPFSLDFIYTDNADQYYLITPPSAGLDVTLHQVKDGGVLLLKEGEELTGQTANWRPVPGSPWVFKLITSVFSTLTIDVSVGPTTVKAAIQDLINSYPKYGNYARSASFSLNDSELGLGGEAAFGYVGSCADSISSLVNSIASSVSLSLYCPNSTTVSAYKITFPPRILEPVDPLFNYISYSSLDRLREGRYIDRDDYQNPGFSATTANTITQIAEGNGSVYSLDRKLDWTLGSTTTGKALQYYSNTALSEDFSLEFFFKPDILDPLLQATDNMPLVEVLTFKHMNVRGTYVQKMGTLIGNTVTVTAASDTQGDAYCGIKKVGAQYFLNVRIGINTWSTHLINETIESYISFQYDNLTNYYSVYLNTERVALFPSILNLNFKTLVLGGGYSLIPFESMFNTFTDPDLVSAWGDNVFYVGKPLEYSGTLNTIRITNKVRHTEVSISIPSSFEAYTNKTVSATLSYSDIVKGTLKLVKMNIPQRASVFLGYARNWSPGNTPAGIFDAFPTWKDSMIKEYYEIYKSKEDLVSTYKFTPVSSRSLESTLLVDPDEAELEAAYRLEVYTRKTLEISMQVHPDHANLQIGDLINLRHHRYGLDPVVGRPAIVIGKSIDYLANTHSIAVLV